MFVGKFGHLTSARSTLHESFFYQEGFVNFLNRPRIFPQSRSNGSDSHRTALKLVYNRTKYLVVYLIQTVLVNIQCLQCKLGYFRVNRTGTLHLCKVAHPAEQGIGNTRRPTAAGSNLSCRTQRARHIQYGSGTTDNVTQDIIIIVFQMQIDSETCTERCRQQTTACCCANQRERIQIYLDATCRRPFINHDINAIVFHGRIKIFFHHRRQAMNFINKEYIIRFETGQHTCQISRFIEHRTGGYLKADSQLVGNDI